MLHLGIVYLTTQRMMVTILLTCGKHLYDWLNSLTEDVWAHKTSLIQPLFIEVLVLSQKSKRSCNLCDMGIDFASFYDLWVGFGILELFWECCIFLFFLFMTIFLQTLRLYFLFLILIMCTRVDLSIILPRWMNQIYT